MPWRDKVVVHTKVVASVGAVMGVMGAGTGSGVMVSGTTVHGYGVVGVEVWINDQSHKGQGNAPSPKTASGRPAALAGSTPACLRGARHGSPCARNFACRGVPRTKEPWLRAGRRGEKARKGTPAVFATPGRRTGGGCLEYNEPNKREQNRGYPEQGPDQFMHQGTWPQPHLWLSWLRERRRLG